MTDNSCRAHSDGKSGKLIPDSPKNLHQELEERLRFETLLTEISSSFVNIPIAQIDDAIKDAQRRICELLALERSSFWVFLKGNPRQTRLFHIHQPESAPVPDKLLDAKDHYPWVLNRLLQGEIVAISRLIDLPRDAETDRQSFTMFGTKSSVVVPLWIGGTVSGALTFASMKKEILWQERIIKRFELIAQIFASVLARKMRKADLIQNRTHLDLATHAAGVGLWSMYLDTGHIWASDKTRELFQFLEVDSLNRESFHRTIHPEDSKRVNQAVQTSIDTDEQLKMEYRVISPGGAIRWIYTSGQRFLDTDGKPARLMGILIDITERKQMEENLQKRIAEIEILKQKLEIENYYLREEIELKNKYEDIVGRSQAMRRILLQVEQVAITDTTVLIQGETGTGKELLARALHRLSARRDRPMVTVNCASLPPTLIESELFGREKGAYTGALTKMVGRFEVADGSTLFLDEIGELPMALQSKLLRVLEQGAFERLGSAKTLHVDVRIIAATNRDILQEIKNGRFRQDLFYRLNVFPIVIPPLRERPDDIPMLVWAFVKEFEKKMGKNIDSLPKKVMQDLKSYTWPGNVRELRNLIEHAMILNNTTTLHIDIPRRGDFGPEAEDTLENLERRHIAAVLEKTGWRISGQGGAAEILGLKRTTLDAKIKKLGLRRSNQTFPI